jgi:hypothetical protein
MCTQNKAQEAHLHITKFKSSVQLQSLEYVLFYIYTLTLRCSKLLDLSKAVAYAPLAADDAVWVCFAAAI